MPTAIPTAITIWTNTITSIGMDVKICEDDRGDDNTPDGSCAMSNTDGFTVRIKVVPGSHQNNKNPFDTIYEDCGLSVGCVYADNPNGGYLNHGNVRYNIFEREYAPMHLENITILIEDPAYVADPYDPDIKDRIYWTNNPETTRGLRQSPQCPPQHESVRTCGYYYLVSTVLHEISHAIGMEHPMGDTTNGITHAPIHYSVPTNDDIQKLRNTYPATHTPHALPTISED